MSLYDYTTSAVSAAINMQGCNQYINPNAMSNWQVANTIGLQLYQNALPLPSDRNRREKLLLLTIKTILT